MREPVPSERPSSPPRAGGKRPDAPGSGALLALLPVVAVAFLPAVAVALLPADAVGQVALVKTEENFRLEPQGTRLARVMEGEELRVVATEGSWVNVVVDGWAWSRSLDETDRGGFDLVVAADGGENLRAEPQGRIRARLLEGMLLEEVERRPGWIRVRRSGWIWRPSVDVRERGSGGATGEEEPSGEEAGGGESGATQPPDAPPPEWIELPEGGGAVLSGPNGDTLGRVDPGAGLRVLDRRGSWARVRLEGWVWAPLPGDTSGGSSVIAGVTPEEVREAPDRYRGRLVEWTLQFISLEEAERIRTDFYEGEPYLQTRPPDGPGFYVFVAVPGEALPRVRELESLDLITVVGRVRTGASELTGNPIIELRDLRTRGGG